MSKPGPAFSAANRQLGERLKKTDIKVATLKNGVALSNKGGNRVTLKADVGEPTKKGREINYEGTVGGKTYRWAVVYSPDGKTVDPSQGARDQFTAFIRAARANYGPESRALVAKSPGTGPIKSETGDTIFCGSLGIILATANPLGAAGVWSLCTWFASNGID